MESTESARPGIAPRIDGGWGWVVVAAAFIVNFIMDGVRYSFGLLYLEFHDHFRYSRGAVGWIGGTMFGLLLITAPIAGALVTRFGCRVVMVAGSITVAVGFFLGAFATSVPYLCATVGLLGGLGFGMMFITYYVALIQYFDRRRSLAIGLAVAGSGLGGFAFNPLSNWLLHQYTWRGTLIILAGISLNVMACGCVMKPVEVRRDKRQAKKRCYTSSSLDQDELPPLSKQELGHQCADAADGNITNESVGKSKSESINNTTGNAIGNCMSDSIGNSVNNSIGNCSAGNNVTESSSNNTTELEGTIANKSVGNKHVTDLKKYDTKSGCFLLDIFMVSLLRNRKFLVFVAVEIFINVSYMVPFIYVPDMVLLNSPGVTRVQVIWLANAMCLANVATRIPVGVAADSPRTNTLWLMASLCGLAGLAVAAMPFCRFYGVLVAACVLYVAGIVSAMVLIPVVLSELFGDEFVASSFGISLFFGGVSGLVGAPLAGWFVDLTGSYTLTFLLAGAEFIAGGALLLVIPHVNDSKRPELIPVPVSEL